MVSRAIHLMAALALAGPVKVEPDDLTGCETPRKFLVVEKLLGGQAILDDLHRPLAVYVFYPNTVLLIVAHARTPTQRCAKKTM
ncbi:MULTISPECIES: hypothetical protein [Mesorhizobium]|uniref:Uncharacterized protein n=2 Tax=Mesorhizobium TaxID=68287 RepID=A0AB38TMG3_9HYPH|nr:MULTISPECIES: hypothetical protein [Mesorhizobium]MDF3156220.1 hypothetical protein [Mesorhizobium sp. XAP10]MDF3216864.1 hypothetical protein [Mesorhizobium ciceri]MDF3249155.1 hypothetical protein [Mesorhizobium sp. XAP4]UTU55187.1 hypothetical protein LRP29_33175 [Mesorhizobium ciceri]